MLNLYQRAKRGLFGKPATPQPPQVFATKGRRRIHTYHIIDRDGREVAFHKSDAMGVILALEVALKTTEQG